MGDLSYDTFISYRRSDGRRIARRLRDRLVSYSLPKGLSANDRRLTAYLDEVYEVATEDFFENTIKPALAASRSLVVIQTPDAALKRPDGEENWVEREIEYFRSLPGDRPIWVALGAGDFGDPLPGRLQERQPNVERVDVRGLASAFGRLSNHELIKFAGPLFKVSPEELPVLRREEERRTRSRRTRIVSGLIVLSTVLTGLSAAALLGWHNANDRLQEQTALRLASQSASVPWGEYDTAFILAAEAMSMRDTPETRIVLADHLNRHAKLARYIHCPNSEQSTGIAIRAADGLVALACSGHILLLPNDRSDAVVAFVGADIREIKALDMAGSFAFIAGERDFRQLHVIDRAGQTSSIGSSSSIMKLSVSKEGHYLRATDVQQKSLYWSVRSDDVVESDQPVDVVWQPDLDFDEQTDLARLHNRCDHEPASRTKPLTTINGETLAFVTESNDILLYFNGECLLLRGHVHNLFGLAVSDHGGPIVASAGQTGRERFGGIVWKPNRPPAIAKELLQPPDNRFRKTVVAASSDEAAVAAYLDGALLLLDESGNTEPITLDREPRKIAVSSNGRSVAVLDDDTIRMFSREDSSLIPDERASKARSQIVDEERLIDIAFNEHDELVILTTKAVAVRSKRIELPGVFESGSSCRRLSSDGSFAIQAEESITIVDTMTGSTQTVDPPKKPWSTPRTCRDLDLIDNKLVRLIATYGPDPIEIIDTQSGHANFLQNP
ncbi:MAG: hypothetical protein AAGE85_02095, partial [Pseudomonadota bacterium]